MRPLQIRLAESLGLVLALAGICNAGAQTVWPADIDRLTPRVSTSSVKATLSDAIRIQPPAAQVAEGFRKFSGIWSGWACSNASCDIKLAIERLDESGATLSYAEGTDQRGLVQDRAEGKFVGNELQATFRSGNGLVMRLRSDGNMDVSFWRGERRIYYGIVSQNAPVYAREVVRVPTAWVEDGRALTLEMVVYRPAAATAGDQAKPVPTLVFNHGSTGRGDQPASFKRTWESVEVGKYFTEKGWQVVFPQRRGRGASDGLYDEGFEPDRSRYACKANLSLPGLDRALTDLDAVMAHLRRQTDVDKQRMLIGGVSRGGILSVVYAGQNPAEFQGVLNFVGGWTGERCEDAARVNPVAFSRGAASKKPMLWLYGENDPFYSLEHSRTSYNAFVAAGGQGEFLTFKLPDGKSGHGLADHPALWQSAVGRYLHQQGLN